MMKPPHPGETIKEDYLVPLGMSVNRLAAALRLARCFGTSAEFRLNLQSLYDLRMAERKVRARIEREVTPLEVTPVNVA